MDGLADDTPFLMPIISVIDYLDRLLGSPQYLGSLCILVLYYACLGGWLDLALISFFALWSNNPTLISTVTHSHTIKSWIGYALATGLAWVGLWWLLPVFKTSRLIWDGPAEPCLIPSRTTHTRLFPKKHSFSYSYLLVGVPIGLKGVVNGFMSIDEPKASGSWFSPASSWYDVNATDYLRRGSSKLGLRGKLDEFLTSEGVNPTEYPHAYLVTAPRYLGYHFNPVSFWYLYSSKKMLSAIVLEVNNTFGERRPYLVLRDSAELPKQIEGSSAAIDGPHIVRVKKSWAKDFHVSPFNSRKGLYSLLASDPLGPNMEGFRGLDITINLLSSKAHPKLIARLFSDGQAVDPSTMRFLQKANFLASWFWVGFITLPRIVKEAAVLYYRHKLHVWLRPEPLKDTWSRLADNLEKDLEAVFRLYLCHLVEQCSDPISVKYVPCGIPNRTEETFSSQAPNKGPQETEQVELRILTPLFYSRFVYYAHDFEAMFSELRDSSTIWVDRPDALPRIFLKKRSPPLQTSSVVDYFSFKTIQALRRRPERLERPMTSAHASSPSSTLAVDIRDFRISPMDAYILGQENERLKSGYRSAVLRLFVAERFFMGIVQIPNTIQLFCQISFAWALVYSLTNLLDTRRNLT